MPLDDTITIEDVSSMDELLHLELEFHRVSDAFNIEVEVNNLDNAFCLFEHMTQLSQDIERIRNPVAVIPAFLRPQAL